jgi:outer membrane protein TolC
MGAATCAQPLEPSLPPGVDLTQPLALVDCARLALAANPALGIADSAARRAFLAVTQARAAQLPQLTLGGSASAATRRSSGGALPGGSADSTSWGADLALTQTIYQSGLTETVRATRASARASALGAEDARRTVILDVAQSYFAALATQALVDVAGRSLQTSMRHAEMSQARITEGAAAPVDQYPFDVEVAQARLAVIAAENQRQTSLTSLKEAIGLPSETDLQPAETLGRPPLDGTLPDRLQTAYRDRPDLRRQQALIDAARLDLRVARIQRGPVVEVTGSAGYGVGDNSGGDAQVLAGVSLPLFDGRFTRARAESARVALDSASQTLRQLRIAVSADVERSYLNAVEAANRIDAAETALRAAQTSLDAAELKYAEGVGTPIEVTDAQLKLRQAEVDRVQALYDYNTALAALRAATGQAAVPGVE